MDLTRIDHVGLAVEDLDAAVAHHEELYGARVVHREEIASDGVEEALITVGDSYIQLVAPTTADSPVRKFLDRKGEGLHHVGYRVDDVAATLARLRSDGVATIDAAPRPGSRGTTVAFLHPRSAMGVLVELVQAPPGDEPAH